MRLGLGLGLLLVVGCGGGEDAQGRGDRLWADSNYTAALAEYRLAMRQGGGSETLVRVAHAYARTGQLERARETYDQLLRRAPEYIDQAVFDYMLLAQRARARGDRFGLAGAVEAALALRPGLRLSGTAASLARYYRDTGEPLRALPLYERALAEAPPDSAPVLLLEMGQLQRARGDCREALGYFEAYGRRARTAEQEREARWHTGSCAYELARKEQEAGRLPAALQYLNTVVMLGLPENLQELAWFERGEALLGLGLKDEALVSYQRVLELNPARTGQLVQRAQRRIDEIRFGTSPG